MIYLSKHPVCNRIFYISETFHRFSQGLLECFEIIKPVLQLCNSMASDETFFSPSSLIQSIMKYRLIHIQGQYHSGKGHLINQICQMIGFHLVVVKLSDIYTATQSGSAMKKKFDRYISLIKAGGNYLAIHFEDFDQFFTGIDHSGMGKKFNCRYVRIFQKVLDSIAEFSRTHFLLFLSTVDDVPIEINHCILVRHILTFPNEHDRLEIINSFDLNMTTQTLHELVKLSSKTLLVELISILKGMKMEQLSSEKSFIDFFKSSVTNAVSGGQLPSLDAITWEDIGGQKEIINEILSIVQLITGKHKLVEGFKIKKSGILLYGEPGTGKTLIGKAVAYECALHFISVKGPELLNMYIGQTEENVRSLFAKVRQMAPCLLFFDELDSLIPCRGFSGDSGGVMDRVVSQFAVEFDTLQNEDNMLVIIIGATNRPDLIDPALLRNGRFDKIFHVTGGLNRDHQLEILKSQTYKLQLEEDVNLEEIVNQFPQRVVTGAEIYGFVSSALMNAIRRSVKMIEEKKQVINCPLAVSMEDFLQSIHDI